MGEEYAVEREEELRDQFNERFSQTDPKFKKLNEPLWDPTWYSIEDMGGASLSPAISAVSTHRKEGPICALGVGDWKKTLRALAKSVESMEDPKYEDKMNVEKYL